MLSGMRRERERWVVQLFAQIPRAITHTHTHACTHTNRYSEYIPTQIYTGIRNVQYSNVYTYIHMCVCVCGPRTHRQGTRRNVANLTQTIKQISSLCTDKRQTFVCLSACVCVCSDHNSVISTSDNAQDKQQLPKVLKQMHSKFLHSV